MSVFGLDFTNKDFQTLAGIQLAFMVRLFDAKNVGYPIMAVVNDAVLQTMCDPGKQTTN